MRRLGNKLREGRLGWFGHVKQREPGYVGQQCSTMIGKRGRGRPKRRYRDTIREDIREAGVEKEDALDRVRWRAMTRCGDP